MKIVLSAVFVVSLLACRSASAPPARQYPLTGKIVALNQKDRTALVDAAAIPKFMEAMTMEYPVKSADEFHSLHVGDRITAIVDVTSDGIYDLSNIKVANSGK